jgi:aerotaxis receptor
MHELDEITQRNTAMVEELAASAQALRNRVDTVSVSTRLLRLRKEEKTVSEMDAVELRKLHRAIESTTSRGG